MKRIAVLLFAVAMVSGVVTARPKHLHRLASLHAKLIVDPPAS